MLNQREIDKILKDLTFKDLELLIGSAQARKHGLEAMAKDEAKAELEKKAEELGFKLTDLYDLSGGRQRRSNGANGEIRQRAPAKPKYISPDGKETYSGRGRPPRWMVAACKVDSYKDVTPKMKERFLIKE
jgi:DNA-binding protein H-NS